MSAFRETVEKLIDKRVAQVAQTVLGVIPAGTLTVSALTHWHAPVVQIANPHGGIHPGGGKEPPHLELYNVPLPFEGWSVFKGIIALFSNSERGVLVGFKGGSLHFPYIISFLSHIQKDKESKGVPNRQPVTAAKVSATAAQPRLAAPALPPPSPAPAPAAPAPAPVTANPLTAPDFAIGQVFQNRYGAVVQN